MRVDRAWVRLSSGRRLDLLDLRPDAWSDEDLATGLSRTYRWGALSANTWRHVAFVEKSGGACGSDVRSKQEMPFQSGWLMLRGRQQSTDRPERHISRIRLAFPT